MAATTLLVLSACNPVYVVRAGWGQAQILSAREPLTRVITDRATDRDTRDRLRFVHDARRFAIEELGFRNAGDAYTSYAELPSDTLALVLSAARRDRLEAHTWWFPITGRVPYRAWFTVEGAERARDQMEAEGFDTFLRATPAFSTLGWFADPVYSTMLRQDVVGVVETVLHELAHNHLFIPGRGRFNESWATFAGHAAAARFFCEREGGAPDSVLCRRAEARWRDARRVSRFLMALEEEVRALYATMEPGPALETSRRSAYEAARDRFVEEVQPELEATRYEVFAREPLNNATLLARTLYFHRLDDFDRLLYERFEGDLRGLLAWIREEAPRSDDPFTVLDLPGRGGGP